MPFLPAFELFRHYARRILRASLILGSRQDAWNLLNYPGIITIFMLLYKFSVILQLYLGIIYRSADVKTILRYIIIITTV
jgi:hypothetical protein